MIASTILVSGLLLTSCKNSAEKVVDAQEDVNEAEQKLAEEKQAFLMDVEAYKKENADKIAANEKSIDDFNARIAKQKKEARVAYQKQIEELNQKNSDMKMKMESFKTESQDDWEKFKVEFNQDMEELGVAFEGFTKKNK